jgi:hypothetical protein
MAELSSSSDEASKERCSRRTNFNSFCVTTWAFEKALKAINIVIYGQIIKKNPKHSRRLSQTRYCNNNGLTLVTETKTEHEI